MSFNGITRLFGYAFPLAFLLTLVYFIKPDLSPQVRQIAEVITFHLTWLNTQFGALGAPQLMNNAFMIAIANWLVSALCVGLGSALLGFGFIPGE